MLGCHRPSRPSRDVTAARRREGGEGQAPTGHHCGGPAFRGVGGALSLRSSAGSVLGLVRAMLDALYCCCCCWQKTW